MKKTTTRFALATALFGSCALAGLTPAEAATVTWDLTTCDTSNAGCSPAVQNHDPGTTETFKPTSGPAGDVLSAAGFTSSFTAIDLYNKEGGGDENGLGIKSDPTGDHEIYANTYVRLNVTSLLSQGVNSFTFTIGSTTNGEGMDVYGSSSANTGLTKLFNDITTEPGSYALSGYNYYYFTYDGAKVQNDQGDNVLLASFTGQSAVPLPDSLPLFCSGLGALGLLGWRRKSKNAAFLAAA
jgi:hypothetical protein